MVKSKVFKIIICILLTMFVTIAIAKPALAVKVDLDEIRNHHDKSNATNKATDVVSAVINVVQIVAAGIAIIMLVVLGIKWISASPSGKAEIKDGATVYIVGAVLIFAAIGLLEIVKRFTNVNINNF